MHNFKELIIWQKAIDLCVDVYKAVTDFPLDERFGLTTQIKRSVVSIAANISEGAGRNSAKEFIHFLAISQGSSFELQTHIIIAEQVKLLSKKTTDELLLQLDEIQKMNRAFQQKLQNDLTSKV